MELSIRTASREDLPALRPLVDAAITELLGRVLGPEQVESSRAIMGLDSQLVDDGTYFVVTADGALAGCGGWSRRATLYGGDHSGGRDPGLLVPGRDPAKVRAMYTHPAFARRGVGRLVLQRCEQAARAEGFTALDLMATLSGLPLYLSAGFVPLEDVVEPAGGVPVPLVRMRKQLDLHGSAAAGPG